jgi:xylem cysteine proteinase
MDFAFAYIMGNQGIHTDEDYPYLMEEGYCKGKQVGTWNKFFRGNSVM